MIKQSDTAPTTRLEVGSVPEVLDVLIVGGGPAGTAAAFRARELGLQVLVIDFDDVLKRIRDYPKDKLILPDFGGGDKMKFPDGGECVASLHFGPIDKDDMCTTWKSFYEAYQVPVRIGIELTGLKRLESVWEANTWNHRTGEPETYRAKHVVLALGRGVPRRFDIPGNTDGVAYKMDDPARYVSGPVCIIGGGTSAAEAVIAISQSKIDAAEECPVYWSYRGSKMPRVSKALADRFFEAYVMNGNIRYHPHSEPVAVVTAEDRAEYISIRVDRKNLPSRPAETVHLEFPKTQCIACIGEDIPESFLKDLGVHMVTWGSQSKKMMAVTPLLETQQPNVYLIGDLLSQSYLETGDFNSPQDGWEQIKHRGNIKSSLRDGVFVAEVIKQRLEGREKVEVVIRDAETPEVAAPDRLKTIVHPSSDESEAIAAGDTRGTADEQAYLVRITAGGVEGDQYPLRAEGATTLGRAGCDIRFPEDTLLSESHASISHKGGDFFLRDDGSRSGTYLKARPEHPVDLADGDLLRLGRQIILLQGDAGGWQVLHYDASGHEVGRYALQARTVFGRPGGRARPDVVLDEQDMTLSRVHMALTPEGETVTLEDLGSQNGTYLKIESERKLEHGDVFRLGGQQFEIRVGEDLPEKTGSVSVEATPAPAAEEAPAAVAQAPGAAPAAAPHVTFKGQNISGPIDPSENLLDWADENEVELDCQCWVGVCGLCAVRVIEGAENLSEPGEKEIGTLQRGGLEPGPARLACQTKVAGPVVVDPAD